MPIHRPLDAGGAGQRRRHSDRIPSALTSARSSLFSAGDWSAIGLRERVAAVARCRGHLVRPQGQGAQWADEDTTPGHGPDRPPRGLRGAHRGAQRRRPRRPRQLHHARRGTGRRGRPGPDRRQLRDHGECGAARHPAEPAHHGRSRAGRPALAPDRLRHRRRGVHRHRRPRLQRRPARPGQQRRARRHRPHRGRAAPAGPGPDRLGGPGRARRPVPARRRRGDPGRPGRGRRRVSAVRIRHRGSRRPPRADASRAPALHRRHRPPAPPR